MRPETRSRAVEAPLVDAGVGIGTVAEARKKSEVTGEGTPLQPLRASRRLSRSQSASAPESQPQLAHAAQADSGTGDNVAHAGTRSRSQSVDAAHQRVVDKPADKDNKSAAHAPPTAPSSVPEEEESIAVRLRRRREEEFGDRDASGPTSQGSQGSLPPPKRRKIAGGPELDRVDPAISGEMDTLASSLRIVEDEGADGASADGERAEGVADAESVRKLRALARLQLRVIKWQQGRLEARAAETKEAEGLVHALEGKVARLERSVAALKLKKAAADEKIARLQMGMSQKKLAHGAQNKGSAASDDGARAGKRVAELRSESKGEDKSELSRRSDASELRDVSMGGEDDEDDMEKEVARIAALKEFSLPDDSWMETYVAYDPAPLVRPTVSMDDVPTPSWRVLPDYLVPPVKRARGARGASEREKREKDKDAAEADSGEVGERGIRNATVARELRQKEWWRWEGYQETSDEAVERRHKKLELEERRCKRWDLQQQRERRMKEAALRFSNRKRGKTPDTQTSDASHPFVFAHNPQDVLVIRIADTLPVSAFGCPLPHVESKVFALPTKGPNSCRRDMELRSRDDAVEHADERSQSQSQSQGGGASQSREERMRLRQQRAEQKEQKELKDART